MASDAILPVGLSTVEQLYLIGAGLIVALIVLWTRLARLRKKALESPGRTDGDLKIDDVEDLHRKGLISDEEFDRLRRKSMGLEAPPRVVADEGAGEKADSD